MRKVKKKSQVYLAVRLVEGQDSRRESQACQGSRQQRGQAGPGRGRGRGTGRGQGSQGWPRPGLSGREREPATVPVTRPIDDNALQNVLQCAKLDRMLPGPERSCTARPDRRGRGRPGRCRAGRGRSSVPGRGAGPADPGRRAGSRAGGRARDGPGLPAGRPWMASSVWSALSRVRATAAAS